MLNIPSTPINFPSQIPKKNIKKRKSPKNMFHQFPINFPSQNPCPIGSMVLLYMVTWIPSIYPLYVSIFLPAPWILLGGSSHLVSGLVHPNYKWINPIYPIYNWVYIPLTNWDEPPSKIFPKISQVFSRAVRSPAARLRCVAAADPQQRPVGAARRQPGRCGHGASDGPNGGRGWSTVCHGFLMAFRCF